MSNRNKTEIQTILINLSSDKERFEWAKGNIIAIQEHSDGLPEWDADFAWIRNDEIHCLAVDFVSSIKDSQQILEIIKADLQHEDWPVRIVTNLIEYLISNNIDLENNELCLKWLDDYRESDPDPTEI